MAGRFTVESVFKAVDRVTAPVRKIQSRIGRFTRSVQRGFRNANRAVNKFGQGLKRVAVVGAAALLALGAGIGSIIRTGAEFEQTLVNAAAKFPEGIRKGSEAFKELEAVARKTGATTEFTASQAAEGLNFLALAGFNAEQSMAALPGVVDLATAAQIDLGTASDIATDSLSAFGLATKDTAQLGKNLARVNDVLAKTSVTANTTIEGMFEAVVKGAADFTKGGQSIETFSALLGIMANSGKKGAEAGTALRNMMLRLADPSKEAGKVLGQLGITVADSNGDFRDAIDILADFERSTKKMGTAQRTAALSTVFGARTVGGINILLSEGAESLREYRRTLEEAGGASKEMAAVMRDTLLGQWKSLMSAIEGVTLTIFNLKETALNALVTDMVKFVRSIDAAINANKELAAELIDGLMQAGKGVLGVFGLLVAKFLIMKTVMLTIMAVTKTYAATIFILSTTMKVLSGALAIARVAMLALNLAFALNPIGLVIIAVTALIAAGVLLVRNWDKIKATILPIIDAIKSALGFILKPILDVIGGFSTLFGVAKSFGLFGDGEAIPGVEAGQGGKPQVVTPQERTARSIEETRETGVVDVNIKDETGRAEMTQKGKVSGADIKLINSGAF